MSKTVLSMSYFTSSVISLKKHETGMNRAVHKDGQKYALLETDEHKMYVENNSKLSKSAKHID